MKLVITSLCNRPIRGQLFVQCAILASTLDTVAFLADHTGQYGRAYGTMFCPSVVCLL